MTDLDKFEAEVMNETFDVYNQARALHGDLGNKAVAGILNKAGGSSDPNDILALSEFIGPIAKDVTEDAAMLIAMTYMMRRIMGWFGQQGYLHKHNDQPAR